jgi:hypothetical protein
MISRFLTTAAAAAFLLGAVAVPTCTHAEMLKKEETKKEETKKATTAKKELTPQQQKMKDCSAKWGEEKKAKKVSGKKAHDEFMSACLKG